MTRRRGWSDITITDQFCGAGGSTIGAVKAGLRGRQALNHWKRAVETYNTNHPNTDVDCTDVSACDPRRYPSTDILITSPECTTHSPAGGSRRRPQVDLFRETGLKPEDIRSRATMFDVVRFSEYHRYRLIIAENVLEVTRWELFPEWLGMMYKLGYQHRVVSLNSMFAHPTPQSRDRIYVVFWQKGNRAPDLEIRPKAACFACGLQVEALQTWKNGRTIGKYRQQYIYTCPKCRREVQPYYYCALNALDLSIPAERIGDRTRPLRPRTLERIQYGLERYGRTALLVRTNMTSGVSCRVRDAVTEPLDVQPASWIQGLVTPAFLVETAYSHAPEDRTRGLDRPLPTQSGQPSVALVSPFFVNGHMSRRVYPGTDPLATQAASREHDAVVVPPSMLITLRGTKESQRGAWAQALDEPTATIAGGGIHQGVIQGAALLTMRGGEDYLLRRLDAPLPVQVAGTQDFLLQRAPFLVSYDRTNPPRGVDDAIPTIPTVEHHALVAPAEELSVEDCYFRMLQPREIGAAMAFPSEYVVLGTKREQVKQYGNAVTPPSEEDLLRRAVATLAPEVAA